MKLTKSKLQQIIVEEIEALIEDNPCKPGYMEKPKGSGKCYPATPTDMGGPFQVEESEELEEAWKGDPEIKQTGQYADKTKEELCVMKNDLMDLDKRTKEEQTKVDQINFAIRSKQKGPKFGKVGC